MQFAPFWGAALPVSSVLKCQPSVSEMAAGGQAVLSCGERAAAGWALLGASAVWAMPTLLPWTGGSGHCTLFFRAGSSFLLEVHVSHLLNGNCCSDKVVSVGKNWELGDRMCFIEDVLVFVRRVSFSAFGFWCNAAPSWGVVCHQGALSLLQPLLCLVEAW